MPSPFPGMNPYLEQPDVWQDFHDRYVPALGDALAALVRPHFFVKIEEHLFIHDRLESSGDYVGNSDVSVTSPETGAEYGESGGVIASPMRLRVPIIDLERQPYLEILDRQSRKVVSVIELLSPSNKKPGALRRQFLYKRGQILLSSASYVEIDLLRGGPRMPLEPTVLSDYCIIVSRYEDRPDVGYWPIGSRERLPEIPIPLPSPVDQVKLDLQAVLNVVFDRAYYADHIYGGWPTPPLNPEDADWAMSLISA